MKKSTYNDIGSTSLHIVSCVEKYPVDRTTNNFNPYNALLEMLCHLARDVCFIGFFPDNRRIASEICARVNQQVGVSIHASKLIDFASFCTSDVSLLTLSVCRV